MDTLETLLAASTPTLESLKDEDGSVPLATSTTLPGDMSSAPFFGDRPEEATIEDVCDGIERSIYGALVAS
ncbi:MAG: hypothetical protein M3340_11940 [Actinomycetota bacterium]|nr:hypothetical protein [Actinomycetota bacterium]